MSIPTSEHYRLLNLVADIRKACGDPHGALMQDDLVEHIQVITEKAQRWDEIGNRPITVIEGPAEITTDTTILRVLEHETVELRVVDRQHAAKITDRQLADALHYPRCWDTATYPTLADALWETVAGVGCSVCGEAARTETPVAWPLGRLEIPYQKMAEAYKEVNYRSIRDDNQAPASGEAVAWVTPLTYGQQVTFYKPPMPEGFDDNEAGVTWYCRPLFYADTHPPAKVPEGWRHTLEEALAMMTSQSMTLERQADAVTGIREMLTTPTPAATPEAEWVKCAERLPEKGVVVLVNVDYDHHSIKPSVLTAHWAGSTFKIGPNSVSFNCDAPVVTHWRELPQPPREQEGE